MDGGEAGISKPNQNRLEHILIFNSPSLIGIGVVRQDCFGIQV